MATILLSAAGLAIGGSVGGSVLGLSSAVIGRAAGAALGRAVDERLLGRGSAPVETGKVDRFRVSGAGEGMPLSRLWGRTRMAGQVIWAGPFVETVQTSGGGGKGAPRRPMVQSHSYSVSLAIALCTGEITSVGRIWADGAEIARDSLTLQVYSGSATQMPDPHMSAVEGADAVPAYRGLAYVVIEDLDLARFGNRVPQFSFEVFRAAPAADDATAEDLTHLVRAVALIPGTGEYALATTPVFQSTEFGVQQPVNMATVQGKTDLQVALDALTGELPQVGSVSLVVSWFGDDLRCGACTVRPRAEQMTFEPEAQPWRVSGVARGAAGQVPMVGGSPVYGGTPSDASVIEAIAELHARGQEVMFYPFILMDQMAGNTLPNPYTGAAGQPVLPWRGRITLSVAPGQDGSPDQTTLADDQVAAFFGQAQPADFHAAGGTITYSGPEEWSFRRMILHYAHLCALAGGVEAFCIGSEMRGLTFIRGASGFPAVDALCTLAAEVRAILPGAKITYAADWSEYHGYQPPGTADKLFHLDPLWAHPDIDLIGIDNYLPLSDWRDGTDHADAHWRDIHNLDYLTANVAGGEHFDWYYHSDEARAAQIRTPISDGLEEPWVWRQKDIKGWWSHPHHDRVGGVRSPVATPWVPQSKPVWFTELGCAAIDKGTNEPNKFLDPKSSESFLPIWSNGQRDDLIQIQYLRAMHRHFADPEHNPASTEYPGRMVDMTRAHVWAWDARPFPAFPARGDLWTDGGNYARGHWLNGRAASRPLDSVVRDICAASGVTGIDISALFGLVRGYRADDTDSARAALQPLMIAYGFDVAERDGTLVFTTRTGERPALIAPETLARDDTGGHPILTRAPEAEAAGRVRLSAVEAEGDYAVILAEAILPDEATTGIAGSDLALVLTRAEARQIAERWLAEARVARDSAAFSLPPSAAMVGAGDILRLGEDPALWRVDRIEDGLSRAVEAVRIEPATYRLSEAEDEAAPVVSPGTAVPVEALILDLPLLSGAEDPYSPHAAFTARPWPGAVALYSSITDSDFALDSLHPAPSVIGTTQTPLFAAPPGLWDRGAPLRVRLPRGALASVSDAQVLSGANLAAIGDGSADNWEVFQFTGAELVAPGTWDLTGRLRGQAGTDGIMPHDWPAGSLFVLLDRTPTQVTLPPALLNVTRHYRWGPAARALDDSTYRGRALALRGTGLRPYAPAHLRLRPEGADLRFDWVRRTRISGDGWEGHDVPLGETAEVYLIRVLVDGILRRSLQVTAPTWTYAAGLQGVDGLSGERVVQVAQLSDVYGPGPFRSLVLP